VRPYYSDDLVTIYHGDCREWMPEADLLLTDPPYGIRADEAASKNKGKWGWKDYGETAWDRSRPPQEIFDAMLAATRTQIIWGGNYFADLLPPSSGWFGWDKGQRAFSLADFEMAWTSLAGAARIVVVPRGRALLDGKQHPTQKSLSVMRWCIAQVPSARSVLDPFAGSGTTLVAAKDAGLSAIGIEIEERYCEIAATRCSQEVLGLDLPA
jgi:DNA modification methylase